MCLRTTALPFMFPLEEWTGQDGRERLSYTPVMAKAMGMSAGGKHSTSFLKEFPYEIGKWAWADKYVRDDHDFNIHVVPTPALPEAAGYGPHQVVGFAANNLWTDPNDLRSAILRLGGAVQASRCYHAPGFFPAICLTCAGLEADDLQDPEVWQQEGILRKTKGGLYALSDRAADLLLPSVASESLLIASR